MDGHGYELCEIPALDFAASFLLIFEHNLEISLQVADSLNKLQTISYHKSIAQLWYQIDKKQVYVFGSIANDVQYSFVALDLSNICFNKS